MPQRVRPPAIEWAWRSVTPLGFLRAFSHTPPALFIGRALPRSNLIQGAPLRFHPHVRVPREHGARDVAGDAHDHLVARARFGKLRYQGVPVTRSSMSAGCAPQLDHLLIRDCPRAACSRIVSPLTSDQALGFSPAAPTRFLRAVVLRRGHCGCSPCSLAHRAGHSTTSRYPIPGSVCRCFGRVGSASSFRRSCAIYTLRYCACST